MGAVTPAAIYRVLDQFGGTLIIDENDMDNKSDMTGIITRCSILALNAVLRSIRCLKENDEEFRYKHSKCLGRKYSPPVIISKTWLLESRCLTTKMQETNRPRKYNRIKIVSHLRPTAGNAWPNRSTYATNYYYSGSGILVMCRKYWEKTSLPGTSHIGESVDG